MKVSQFKRELRSYSSEPLHVYDSKWKELARELFFLKLRLKTSPLKDISLLKKLRKNIARVLTVRHEYFIRNFKGVS